MVDASSFWLANPGGSFYNGVIEQSLRLSKGSNYKLDRQMVTPTSVTGTICTTSWWMKKCAGGAVQSFVQCRDNQASGEYAAYWTFGAASGTMSGTDSHTFRSAGSEGSVLVGAAATVTPYRDSTSWYHVVIRYDSTQGTAANRIRIYINGVLQTLTNTTYPGEDDVNQFWNNAGEHLILFGNGEDSGDSFDGYIAEFNWVDGLSLAPESFGEDKKGVWIPKLYSGSYGLNGCRYTFSDSSDIGADSSGVGNDLDRVSNLAATDVVPDSPENNFATLMGGQIAESSDYQGYVKGTYTEGNLKITGANGNWSNGKSNQLVNSGKWYAEFVVNGWVNSVYVRLGVYARPARTYDEYYWLGNGDSQIDGTRVDARTSAFALGAVIQIAIDLENNNIFFGQNNTWENSATESEIEAGTATNAFASGSEVPTGDGHYYGFYVNPHPANTNISCNFGQDPTFAGIKDSSTTALTPSNSGAGTADSEGNGKFFYAPPDGFLALCTANIAEPLIGANSSTQANAHMQPVIYEGDTDGTDGAQNIPVNFKPDLTWIKNRDATDPHQLFDSSRGETFPFAVKEASKGDIANDDTLTDFIATGFTLGDDVNVNTNNESYVSWNWKANGSTTSSNSAGSIASTVQANTDAGFSIVEYHGTGANATFGHGVQVNGIATAPAVMWFKHIQGEDSWAMWHHTGMTANNQYYPFNTVNPLVADGNMWNAGVPSTTVVNLGTNSLVNRGSPAEQGDFVCYCFAEIEGYSKFGFYNGNNSGDGTFVYVGFKPAFVLTKRGDGTASNWYINDTARSLSNPTTPLYNDSNIAEAGNGIDILSNGFKIRNADASQNAAVKYIYMAFAEESFKYANAR